MAKSRPLGDGPKPKGTAISTRGGTSAQPLGTGKAQGSRISTRGGTTDRPLGDGQRVQGSRIATRPEGTSPPEGLRKNTFLFGS